MCLVVRRRYMNVWLPCRIYHLEYVHRNPKLFHTPQTCNNKNKIFLLVLFSHILEIYVYSHSCRCMYVQPVEYYGAAICSLSTCAFPNFGRAPQYLLFQSAGHNSRGICNSRHTQSVSSVMRVMWETITNAYRLWNVFLAKPYLVDRERL